MSRLIHELLKEERRLNYLVETLLKSLDEAPDGNLRISRCGKSVQYYIKPGGKSNSKGLTLKESSLKEMNYDKSNYDESGLNEISAWGGERNVKERSRGDWSDRDQAADKFSERPADEMSVRYSHPAANAMKSEKGIYVRKSDEKLAFAIAQRDYDSALLKLSEKRLNCVQSLLEQLQKGEMEKLYDKLKPLRRTIVKPKIVTDEKFAEKWSDVQYEGKIFEEGTAVIYTNRGERVRSKSEKIIADMLSLKGVPYRYEAPFAMRGIGTVYPDFTVWFRCHKSDLKSAHDRFA
ncbi:MAG: hypothetical protein LUG27_04625, partial [Clostridiales bacterium]|nr:hypothetical protein [Clostridiales bacterium]